MEKGKNPYIDSNKLTRFEKYLLSKEDINIDEINSLYLTLEILKRHHLYVLVDLVTDIQFTLYKDHLYSIYGQTFSNEEVYSMASPAISRKLSYKDNSLSFNNLQSESTQRILHDIFLINALKEKGISLDLKELKMIFPNFKSILYFTSEKACIENIILREQLIKLGLGEYSKRIITNVFGEETHKNTNEDKMKNNFKFSFNITRKKEPIKILIEKHNK